MLFGWEMKLGRIKHFGATQSSSSSRTTAAVNECHRRTKRAHTAKSNHHTARKTCLSSHLPVGLGVFPHCLLLVGRQMEVHEMVQHWNFTLYVTAISQLIPLGPRRRCTYAHTSLHTRTHTHTYTTRSDVHRKSYCIEMPWATGLLFCSVCDYQKTLFYNMQLYSYIDNSTYNHLTIQRYH